MLRGEVMAEVGTADALEEFVANGNGFFGLACRARTRRCRACRGCRNT
jgi:hypothetical protein